MIPFTNCVSIVDSDIDPVSLSTVDNVIKIDKRFLNDRCNELVAEEGRHGTAVDCAM